MTPKHLAAMTGEQIEQYEAALAKKKVNLTAMEFWHKVGTDVTKAVCVSAGTSFSYYEHIKHGRKRPGYTLAKRLNEESKRITGFELGVTELLEANAALLASQG